MQILENILSDNDVVVLKEYWEKNNHLTYKNAFAKEDHPWRDRSDFIDRRLLIVEGTKAWDIIRRVVDSVDPSSPPMWANYQRQSICHQLHVDEYGKDRGPDQQTFTIIFALEDQPKFKTVVFKELANDGDEMEQLLYKIPYHHPRKNNSSKEHDLDHMNKLVYGRNHNYCDWLTLDGVFAYLKGWGVMFDTNQLHSTSNWCKYPEFTHRDLVQVHFGYNAGALSETHFTQGRGEAPPEDGHLRQMVKD
jgi:hypothetical protein